MLINPAALWNKKSYTENHREKNAQSTSEKKQFTQRKKLFEIRVFYEDINRILDRRKNFRSK